ncbi:carboxylating nicotinate-nucleotide diphosphorylase [Corynebacterium liangguodongii]|uniref:Nicotinate-nucleotide pyrophosphorylase [carboxylating] n=1 Tax=Corynebacterium liangguodongii TaxID=2079535 RepID=A0A2S0WG99_9CORY|nr:carboxylating nicotinate-nucleotide diphosphorylase [Corynebacterium liangguodongii]AWB84712.1 carboxylating nicotinate-nucleotide diphosphorylase [Corynebacterium liangguodongii]PWB99720.1 carboxylating nicotinate-nucleotide diphosphorylase [Corynebacterium liangguodongii]
MTPLDQAKTRDLIRVALDEDLAFGPDATTLATIGQGARCRAALVTRSAGVIAGLAVVGWALPHARVELEVADGDAVGAGTTLALIDAPTRDLLTAERTILNLLCHASGIATQTRRWVEAVAGTGARIRDTRKTLPGMRDLQKYAVRAGGGVNHRMGLGDCAMIKDNHVAAAGLTGALERVRAAYPGLPCEVEVDTLGQLDELFALGTPPELVLLDNFTVEATAAAVGRRNEKSPRTLLESSGGLTLERAREFAETGVDYLAVGALTHSVRALDIGLDYQA